MSVAFYTVAACTYIAANLILLRMVQSAGSIWKAISLSSLYEVPGQVTRFVIFGICLFMSFACIVVGGSLETGHPPF